VVESSKQADLSWSRLLGECNAKAAKANTWLQAAPCGIIDLEDGLWERDRCGCNAALGRVNACSRSADSLSKKDAANRVRQGVWLL
jgi:hypothetical protein